MKHNGGCKRSALIELNETNRNYKPFKMRAMAKLEVDFDNLDLNTLMAIYFKMSLFSDMTTKSLGYQMIDDDIKKLIALANTDKSSEALRLQRVMPCFLEKDIEALAFKWSSERSIGDAEQDSQCMYDYTQGMRAMQNLLCNKA